MSKSSSSAPATTGVVGHRHVAVCPLPFSSHPPLLLLLARKIASASADVEVSFFTTEASAAALSASFPPQVGGRGGGGVRIRLVDDGLEGESDAAVPHLESIRRFMKAAGASLRRSMAAAEEEIGVKISCVVADAFIAHVCREIAEERGVKWAAMWTSAASALAAHMYTDELRRRVASQGGVEACKGQTVDGYIPGFPPIAIGHLAREVIVADLSSSPIAEMLQLMSHALPDATAVATNSLDSLEPASDDILKADFGNIFLGCGPYSVTLSPPTDSANDPSGCLSWLDAHSPASVLYISFGTTYAPPPEEFVALAEALEAVGVPFLWSLPERSWACLPEGFVERTRGKVVAWAPQASALGHTAVGAQLTHCGWNSVMESVVSGVPMICRPMAMAEQKFNERLVVGVWGIGVEVEGGKLTRTAVVRAVERVMKEEGGRAIRAKIQEMKTLAEEAATEPDGSSVRNLNKFINIVITG